MEKFFENLQEAEKKIRTVDHMFYITFPLIKDKKLLLKIIIELKTAIKLIITSVLQYEYIFKRITLYNDSKSNMNTFKTRCAPRYNISQPELIQILELFEIVEKHKQASFEFIKNDKITILSESLEQTSVSIEKTKEFLNLAKNTLEKAKQGIIGKVR